MSRITLEGVADTLPVPGPVEMRVAPGTKLRLHTRERGIIEMALDERGQTLERTPEPLTVERAEIVTPHGAVFPITRKDLTIDER